MDLNKPAPWTTRPCLDRPPWCRVYDAKCGFVLLAETIELAEEIVLGRNAFDVMLRRGWGVGFADQQGLMHGWYVKLPEAMFPLDSALYPLANLRKPDPFTALVEADRWYRENVENSLK